MNPDSHLRKAVLLAALAAVSLTLTSCVTVLDDGGYHSPGYYSPAGSSYCPPDYYGGGYGGGYDEDCY